MNIYTFDSGKIIKHWGEIEAGALPQFQNLAASPFTFRQPAAMPDNHLGYGMPIGGVWATQGVIVPNAVGVDIGCGMAGVFLNDALGHIIKTQYDVFKRIVGAIREAIPVGMTHHKTKQSLPWTPGGPITYREDDKAAYQIGTLGGGNHFIEIQRVVSGDRAGQYHLMIHSGSRNIGKQVCDHYNKVAKELNSRWHSTVPAEWDLAFLPVESPEGQFYIVEMDACVEFARLNRERMIQMALSVFAYFGVASDGVITQSVHNFARQEHHFGANVWVHRKGATPARSGLPCLIPGSQGTASYIGVGLGNPDSYESCSHGAGRAMGRKEAQRSLDLGAEIARLDAMGVLHSLRGKSDLDEAPGAYKNVEIVMAAQSDLVKIVSKLAPLAVIKG